jgi:hypothetical protein
MDPDVMITLAFGLEVFFVGLAAGVFLARVARTSRRACRAHEDVHRADSERKRERQRRIRRPCVTAPARRAVRGVRA